jgi:4'-phosphopantetheinyl transferase
MRSISIIAIKTNVDFDFERYLYLFDNKVCAKILSYKFRKDQIISFTSELLKYYYLPKYLKFGNIEISEDAYHRPFIRGLSDTIDFNISHSGEYVVMVIGHNMKLGIDIEFIDSKVNLFELAPTVFSESECQLITDVSKFFILWTKKEAMLKCIGHGFMEDTYKNTLLNCEDLQEYELYRLYTKQLGDYYLSICIRDFSSD